MTSVINPAEPGPAADRSVDAAGLAVDADPTAPPYPYQPAPAGRLTGFLLRLWDRSPRWLAPAAILACFAGATGYVLISDPTDSTAEMMPTCVVKLTTGFDCPGCGGTRAFAYLLQGNLPAAARHHLLFVFALPFLIYLYVAWAGQQVFRRNLPALRLPPVTIGVFLGAWAAFTILRNLPWEPFTWLYV